MGYSLNRWSRTNRDLFSIRFLYHGSRMGGPIIGLTGRVLSATSEPTASVFVSKGDQQPLADLFPSTHAVSMYSLYDSSIPLVYRGFFLVFEPLTVVLAACYAYFTPRTYLALLAYSKPTTALDEPSQEMLVSLYQLANMYMMFALNEALVLGCTQNRRVWRILLFGLFVADLGHLATLWSLGSQWYWRIDLWNEMHVGGIGLVYFGASMRLAYICGVGLKPKEGLIKVQ
ncbi:hypothetical protein BKA62DRAFT_504777 [Auriculariales sp. MPI-PUGE-AT-0066]|nr:hypothetical protein BKA62DRAFT_504777 [Auriculariales sp. MPI-PUGE-AT-0066]